MNEKRDDFVGFTPDVQKDKPENFLENMEIGTSIEKLKSQLPSNISIKEDELAKAMNDIFSNQEKINTINEAIVELKVAGITSEHLKDIIENSSSLVTILNDIQVKTLVKISAFIATILPQRAFSMTEEEYSNMGDNTALFIEGALSGASSGKIILGAVGLLFLGYLLGSGGGGRKKTYAYKYDDAGNIVGKIETNPHGINQGVSDEQYILDKVISAEDNEMVGRIYEFVTNDASLIEGNSPENFYKYLAKYESGYSGSQEDKQALYINFAKTLSSGGCKGSLPEEVVAFLKGKQEHDLSIQKARNHLGLE